MSRTPPTLAVLTSGGDAPGMNGAVHTLTRLAHTEGWRVLGVREGFQGLRRGDFTPLDASDTLRWARYGGTFLGTSRLPDFRDHLATFQEVLTRAEVTHLAVLGGNGSLWGAGVLAEKVPGLLVAGLPATIDNDVPDSELSLGFGTAVETGVALMDGLHDTAEAMPRLFALETLGGETGFLAQAVCEAGGGDALLVPEGAVTEGEVVAQLEPVLRARRYALIVASEGYAGYGSRGGDLVATLERISSALGTRYRLSRLGHAQRGGRPCASDRLLASALAHEAFAALYAGRSAQVLWQRGRAAAVPFSADASVKPPLKPWNPRGWGR